MKSIEERKAILDIEIAEKLKKGWRLAGRTETGCKLVRDKSPNGLLLFLLLTISFLPGLGYTRTKRLFVEVNEEGEICRKNLK